MTGLYSLPNKGGDLSVRVTLENGEEQGALPSFLKILAEAGH